MVHVGILYAKCDLYMAVTGVSKVSIVLLA